MPAPPNRNPIDDTAEIETRSAAYTGATKVVWLGLGVVDDETDGHVDNLCVFVRPGRRGAHRGPTTATTRSTARSRGRAPPARGRDATPAAGRSRCTCCTSPVRCTSPTAEAAGVDRGPGTQPRRAGDRLGGLVRELYPANGVVVVPLLDPRHDAAALATLAALYPDRDVVGVPAREILLGGGNIHCITQPVPAPAAETTTPT